MVAAKWNNGLGARLPRVLVENFSLKPGDESEVVAATIDAHRGVKDVRRAQAVDRMRARGWRFLEGYAFDRDEADA